MNDPFVEQYKAFLERVSDNDAAKAAGNAKESIEYFQRMLESYTESIGNIKGNIEEIKNKPTMEIAEKKYGGAKARLIVDTILLVVAPLAAVGFVILAIALLIGTIQGDPHIVGIILSIVAAVIFACITKFVWKHYRGSINSFKRKRVTKLQEDHVNDERAKNDAKNIDSKNNTISEYEGNIEFLKKGIEEINGYLAIDRSKRISYFTKQHWDAAGIDNSIVIDEAIVRFHEIEKDYKVYPGYKSVSKLS